MIDNVPEYSGKEDGGLWRVVWREVWREDVRKDWIGLARQIIDSSELLPGQSCRVQVLQ